MYRFIAACVASAICLSPATGLAAAKVKSHSNTNNNRFAAQCARLGGKTVDTGDGTSCVLPTRSGAASMAIKGTGVPTNLAAACTQDGGRIIQKGGAAVCQSGKPAS